MLTTDRKLDRRITLEARSLCRHGYHVIILSFPYQKAYEDYQHEPFEVVCVGKNLKGSIGNPWERISSFLLKIYQALEGRDSYLDMFRGSIKSMIRAYCLNLEEFYRNLFLQESLRAQGNVYHVHDLHPLPSGSIATRQLGAKLVYDCHELFIEQEFNKKERRKWSHIEQKYIYSVDRVITINKSIARELQKRYGIQLPAIIQNCESRAQRDKSIQSGKSISLRRFVLTNESKIVLYQGGLLPNRNIEVMIRSMNFVSNPHITLVILGNGELRAKLNKIVKKERLERRVLLVPAVSQDELIRITAFARVGVIPYQATCLNTYYCTPNKLYEFIAAGIPLLVNDLPELRNIITKYEIGWVADLSTPERAAKAVNQIFSNDVELEVRRKNSIKAFETLCWEEEEKKLLALYEQL